MENNAYIPYVNCIKLIQIIAVGHTIKGDDYVNIIYIIVSRVMRQSGRVRGGGFEVVLRRFASLVMNAYGVVGWGAKRVFRLFSGCLLRCSFPPGRRSIRASLWPGRPFPGLSGSGGRSCSFWSRKPWRGPPGSLWRAAYPVCLVRSLRF